MNQKIKLALSSIAVVVLGVVVIIYGQVIIQKFQQPEEAIMPDDPEDEVFEDQTPSSRLKVLDEAELVQQEREVQTEMYQGDIEVEQVDRSAFLDSVIERQGESVLSAEGRMNILNTAPTRE